jgi:ABC-type lipoprotein release transport system permease subunit
MALKAHETQHFPGKRAIIRGNPPAVHDRKGPKASNFIEFYKKQTLQPVARHVAADPSTSGREVAVVVTVPVVLSLVALLAVWMPATRASRLHPQQALRIE